MDSHNVCEWNVQAAVAAKGYYPIDTLIQDYDPEFVQGVLIGAWSQVFEEIKKIQETQYVPFD